MDVCKPSETSHSKSSLGKFQHQYLPQPELLDTVYSYHLMVLCISYVGGCFKVWIVSSHQIFKLAFLKILNMTLWSIFQKQVTYTERKVLHHHTETCICTIVSVSIYLSRVIDILQPIISYCCCVKVFSYHH